LLSVLICSQFSACGLNLKQERCHGYRRLENAE
jgi:hypothetical protein